MKENYRINLYKIFEIKMENPENNKIDIENSGGPISTEDLNKKLREIFSNTEKPFKDRVQDIMQTPELYNHIVEMLNKQGFSNKKVVLCTKVFAINPNERNDYFFELEYKDLQEVIIEIPFVKI